MKSPPLKIVTCDELSLQRQGAIDDATLATAESIVAEVRRDGEPALRKYAEQFGDLASETSPSSSLPSPPESANSSPPKKPPLVLPQKTLSEALKTITPAERQLLERIADRIASFATAQRQSLRSFELAIPGGRAGQQIDPVELAGCYAPGGRFPLPSSVLMTAITARVAGVGQVWVASPKPTHITLAAAAVAGVDGFLAVGGAQAIAALAYGAAEVPACDVVVGPGNRFVTAAKQVVSRHVAIDMLAGPSELVVLADGSTPASLAAADLLAQAEHAHDAVPILVATDRLFIDEVNRELATQLQRLATASVAAVSLERFGQAVSVQNMEEAIAVCDRIAPEHLALHVVNAESVASRVKHFGALFLGAETAEVLGDYGAGPNHTLPTGGTSRHSGGLSVLDFLRVRTWLEINDSQAAKSLQKDAEMLARLEGLEGHARSAKARIDSLGGAQFGTQ